ncbi:MAG: hypothetical protein Tsb0014_24010 [Pleurocapsa sp.]
MTQATSPDNKNTIMAAFSKLLTEYQQTESKVATKEEEAEKAKNQQLLTKTTDYTVDNIVNSMASLQLNFGGIIHGLTDNLTIELDKLEELKKAIAVEREHLQQLSKVRLVADALHILNQEHQAKINALKNQTASQKEAIEKEIAQARKEWEKEQAEWEAKVQEAEEQLIKQREQEEADYQYELERQRTIETNDYEEDKKLQERELQEIGADKNKDWKIREKYLADNLAEFTKNQEKIAGFEEKLKEEYNKAKGEAIKDAERKARVETDLLEKEWEAAQQGSELKLASLSATIEHQTEQIAELNKQLQEVNTQAQNLAMQAFQNTSK